uniref:Uncharacterized protein n=1 Tax=Rhizophora mucronata TaxID=61149 RepID=A0A2P2MHB7_RHIMU
MLSACSGQLIYTYVYKQNRVPTIRTHHISYQVFINQLDNI